MLSNQDGKCQNADANGVVVSSVTAKLIQHMYPWMNLASPEAYQNPIEFNFPSGTGAVLPYEQFWNRCMYTCHNVDTSNPDFSNLGGQTIQMTQYVLDEAIVTQATTAEGQPLFSIWNMLPNSKQVEQEQKKEMEMVNKSLDDDEEDAYKSGYDADEDEEMTQYVVTQATTAEDQPLFSTWNMLPNSKQEEEMEIVNASLDDDDDDDDDDGQENRETEQRNGAENGSESYYTNKNGHEDDEDEDEEDAYESGYVADEDEEIVQEKPRLTIWQHRFMLKVFALRDEEERIEKERIEQERIEKERMEKERIEKERIEKEKEEAEKAEFIENMARAGSRLQQIREEEANRPIRQQHVIDCLKNLPTERKNNHRFGIFFPCWLNNECIDFLINPDNRDGIPWVAPPCPPTRAKLALCFYETQLNFLVFNQIQSVVEHLKEERDQEDEEGEEGDEGFSIKITIPDELLFLLEF